jgi:hypothetical protein
MIIIATVTLFHKSIAWMKKYKVLIAVFLTAISTATFAQNIAYSEPDKDDVKSMNYEIMGRMNGNILIYKNYRDVHYVSVYDADMKLKEKIKLDFFSNNKILSTDFLQYPDFFYLFYQYQRKGIVYANVIKIDGDGHRVGQPFLLDTTAVDYNLNSKIYTFINSEDKQHFMLFKINSRNERVHYVTTCLFDKDLMLQQKVSINVPLNDRNSFLTEFQLDNDADLVCVRASGSSQNDNINKLTLLTKSAKSDSFQTTELPIKNIYLDDIRIKVDNYNKHYLATSFCSKQRRGNVDGLYCYLWDKTTGTALLNTITTFSDELRADAKGGEGNAKMAFNDYFLRNIVMKKDGGFVLAAESVYSSYRGNNYYNRWDYFGNPYSYYGYGGFNSYYSSPYGYYYPWDRYNTFNNITRYYADNVVLISFDVSAKMQWSNVVRKSQFDDNSDDFIGYGMLNSGDQVHFLFNVQEKRQTILTDQSITPDGQLLRAPTFRNLDRGYDFMPRHAKQTGSRQLIVPCQYRNYVCFAKIDY